MLAGGTGWAPHFGLAQLLPVQGCPAKPQPPHPQRLALGGATVQSRGPLPALPGLLSAPEAAEGPDPVQLDAKAARLSPLMKASSEPPRLGLRKLLEEVEPRVPGGQSRGPGGKVPT